MSAILTPVSLSFIDLFKQDQLSFLMKHQHNSMEVVDFVPGTKQPCLGYFSEGSKPAKAINNVHDVCETRKGGITKVPLKSQ